MENNKSTPKILVMEQPFQLKPYTKTQLVKMYRPITMYVLNKWLKEIAPQTGAIIGRTLSIKQMEIFVQCFGIPGQLVKEAA